MIALGQKCTLSLETLPLSAPVLEAHLFVLHRRQEFFFFLQESGVPWDWGWVFGDSERSERLDFISYKLCLIDRLCCARNCRFDCKSVRFIKHQIWATLLYCCLNVSMYESFFVSLRRRTLHWSGWGFFQCSTLHENLSTQCSLTVLSTIFQNPSSLHFLMRVSYRFNAFQEWLIIG